VSLVFRHECLCARVHGSLLAAVFENMVVQANGAALVAERDRRPERVSAGEGGGCLEERETELGKRRGRLEADELGALGCGKDERSEHVRSDARDVGGGGEGRPAIGATVGGEIEALGQVPGRVEVEEIDLEVLVLDDEVLDGLVEKRDLGCLPGGRVVLEVHVDVFHESRKAAHIVTGRCLHRTNVELQPVQARHLRERQGVSPYARIAVHHYCRAPEAAEQLGQEPVAFPGALREGYHVGLLCGHYDRDVELLAHALLDACHFGAGLRRGTA